MARSFGIGGRDDAVEAEFSGALAQRGGFDVVHFHHLTGMSLGLPAIAHGSGARVVFTLHDQWLRCARGQLIDHAGERCPGPDVDRCAHCLGAALWGPIPQAHRLPARTGPVKRRNTQVALALQAIHLLHSPSAHLARDYSNAVVIPLPLLRSQRPAARTPDGPLRFLFLGTMLPTKGPHIALEAFTQLRLPDAQLTLAGPILPFNGSTRWADDMTARAEKTENVRVRGDVDHAEVPALFDEHDVLLFPSLWEENSPFVLREATAAGLRIIASEGAAADEIAPEARRAAPGDVAAWTKAMQEEIGVGRGRRPPVTWPSMAAHAQSMVERYRALR